MNQKRIAFIDIARGFAILAVIAVHTGFLPLQHQLLPLITPWMLPVFAVLHGWLAKDTHSFADVAVKRFRSLIVPYCIAGFVSYALWLGLRWYAVDTVLFVPWDMALRQILLGTSLVFNGPLWFLPAFFIATVIFEINRATFTKGGIAKALLLAATLMFFSFTVNPTKSHVVFSYDLSLLLASFMLVGERLRAVHWEKIQMGTWIAVGVGFVALSIFNGTIDMFGREFGNPWLYLISAHIGSGLVIGVAQRMAERKWWVTGALAVIGRHSLLVLVTHWPMMQWLTFVLTILGLVPVLGGTPTYTSFSYDHPSAIVFTLIELPLLALYMAVPLLILPVAGRLRRAYL